MGMKCVYLVKAIARNEKRPDYFHKYNLRVFKSLDKAKLYAAHWQDQFEAQAVIELMEYDDNEEEDNGWTK